MSDHNEIIFISLILLQCHINQFMNRFLTSAFLTDHLKTSFIIHVNDWLDLYHRTKDRCSLGYSSASLQDVYKRQDYRSSYFLNNKEKNKTKYKIHLFTNLVLYYFTYLRQIPSAPTLLQTACNTNRGNNLCRQEVPHVFPVQ